MTEAPVDKQLFEMVTETEADVASGEVVAIAIIVVTSRGEIKKRIRYRGHTPFHLLAGLELVAHNVKHAIESQLGGSS